MTLPIPDKITAEEEEEKLDVNFEGSQQLLDDHTNPKAAQQMRDIVEKLYNSAKPSTVSALQLVFING